MGEKKPHQHLQKCKEYAGNSRDHSLHKHQCWHKSTAFSHYFTNALPYWSRGIGNTQLGCNCMLNNFLLFMYDVVEFIKNIADEIQIINQYKSPLYSARLIRFALQFHYTSLPPYKLLYEEIKLLTISLLRQIVQGVSNIKLIFFCWKTPVLMIVQSYSVMSFIFGNFRK